MHLHLLADYLHIL